MFQLINAFESATTNLEANRKRFVDDANKKRRLIIDAVNEMIKKSQNGEFQPIDPSFYGKS